MKLNEVYLGDCLKLMREIRSESIDMILADLPYGVTNRNRWDSVIPLSPLWEQYERIIKLNGAIVLTGVQPFSSLLIASNLKMYRYDWIWVKNKSTNFLNAKKMPLRKHENVHIFYKKLPVYNPQMKEGYPPVNSYTKHTSDGSNYGKTKLNVSGGGQTNRYPSTVVEIPVMNNDNPDKFHPTQKPVDLFTYFIKTYTNEEAVVLDNAIGSGTTAISCLETNRNFIGMENQIWFFNKAQERISNFRSKNDATKRSLKNFSRRICCLKRQARREQSPNFKSTS